MSKLSRWIDVDNTNCTVKITINAAYKLSIFRKLYGKYYYEYLCRYLMLNTDLFSIEYSKTVYFFILNAKISMIIDDDDDDDDGSTPMVRNTSITTTTRHAHRTMGYFGFPLSKNFFKSYILKICQTIFYTFESPHWSVELLTYSFGKSTCRVMFANNRVSNTSEIGALW